MKTYQTKRFTAPGAVIASVAGSSGAYDITLTTGLVVTAYNNTTGVFVQTLPVAGDLCLFGMFTGKYAPVAANAQVIPAAQVADWVF